MKLTYSNRTFKRYDTPEYQWTRVPKNLIDLLGLTKSISRFARMNTEYVFIGEPEDWIIFEGAYIDFYGHEPKLDVYTNKQRSRIWNYEYFDQQPNSSYTNLKSRIMPLIKTSDTIVRLLMEHPSQLSAYMRKKGIPPKNAWERTLVHGYNR